jgi:hypothetical protein
MTLSSPQVAGIHAAQDHHLPGRLRYQSTWPTSYSTAAEIRVAGFAVWAASKSLSTANCISLRTDGDNWIRTTTDEFSEGYHIAMQTLDQYRGTIIVCSYYPPPSLLLPETLPLLKASFHDAISRVVLAQPHLHVGIIGEKSKDPYFVRLKTLDLRKHIDWKIIDDSRSFEQSHFECLQAHLDLRYENLSTQPGWKIILMHRPGAEVVEAMYVWNHTHHDGMSGKIFHQQLLRNLNETSLHKKEPLPDSDYAQDSILSLPDPTNKLPPNPELLSSWPMSPSFAVKALWNQLKPAWKVLGGNTYATWAPINTSSYATRFHNFTINDDIVSKVVSACRQHNTTLTGLVHALVLVSLTRALKDAGGFVSWTPYDLRHILPESHPKYPWLHPKDSMCNYVSVVDHEFKPDLMATIRSTIEAQTKDAGLSEDMKSIIWSISARVRREIQTRLDSGLKNDLIGIMKLCSNWLTEQRSEACRVRHLSWLVTNLGVFDGQPCVTEDQEGWSLRRAQLVLSAEVPSAALSISIMTVKGGDMCVTCSWQDCVVDISLAERLMVDLERWLKEIGS